MEIYVKINDKKYQKVLTYKKPCVILGSEDNDNDYHYQINNFSL